MRTALGTFTGGVEGRLGVGIGTRPWNSYKDILGYKIPVAAIEDVFQGKVWAAMDETRRPSKRQKDLADILRLMETRRGLKKLLPGELKRQLEVG